MAKSTLAGGIVHTVPKDLRENLLENPEALSLWNDLTPLARNEWICWATSVKKPETRKNHIERIKIHLREGKRWPGCPHR